MTAPVEPSDVVADLAQRLVDTLGAINRRLDAIAADVRLLRDMADAERQGEGRAAFPQPAGWVAR